MSDALTNDLIGQFQSVRSFSELLCEPLQKEDMVVQSMPDVSPTKWHLAHTTWFFETFLLKPEVESYRPFNEAFEYLFNSYYNGVGAQFPRPNRGLLSRPTVDEVLAYRQHVDQAMTTWLKSGAAVPFADLIQLGLNHEQQHQELLLTDIKHVLSINPLHPTYKKLPKTQASEVKDWVWHNFDEVQTIIGCESGDFCFDNELPVHTQLILPFQMANRPVTTGEFLAFIDDGGYQNPLLWLSEGWNWVKSNHIEHPAYWKSLDGEWFQFTLGGLEPLNLSEPVSHLSYFEADAFAQWAEARLPTEFEWEYVAKPLSQKGNFVEQQRFHPNAINDQDNGLVGLFGDVWEWTSSSYAPYPGFKPPAGAVGEYNGKFMCNQYVLRGGSCVTAADHIRSTYRNFFPTDARWQFTGLRLARSL